MRDRELWTLERLQQLIEAQAQHISRLEKLLSEKEKLLAEALACPGRSLSTSNAITPPNEAVFCGDSNVAREDLIAAITQWRVEHGIITGPQRYLRNRSTAQLQKMYDQIRRGSTSRLGRTWTARRRTN